MRALVLASLLLPAVASAECGVFYGADTTKAVWRFDLRTQAPAKVGTLQFVTRALAREPNSGIVYYAEAPSGGKSRVTWWWEGMPSPDLPKGVGIPIREYLAFTEDLQLLAVKDGTNELWLVDLDTPIGEPELRTQKLGTITGVDLTGAKGDLVSADARQMVLTAGGDIYVLDLDTLAAVKIASPGLGDLSVAGVEPSIGAIVGLPGSSSTELHAFDGLGTHVQGELPAVLTALSGADPSIDVCSGPCDATTITDGVAAAGDWCTIAVNPERTYDETVLVDRPLNLQSADRGKRVKLTCSVSYPLVIRDQHVKVRGFDITPCGKEAVWVDHATATLQDLRVANATADPGSRPGVRIDGGWTLIRDSRFENLTSTVDGAAVRAQDTELLLMGSTFAGCRASSGGAVYYDGGVRLEVLDSAFDGNVSTSATLGGGSIYLRQTADASIVGSTFEGGGAAIKGGHVRADDATLRVRESAFSGATAQYGGSLYASVTDLTLENTTVEGASAVQGGGLYHRQAGLWVTGGRFAGNSASDLGGGLVFYYGSRLDLEAVDFEGNSAANYGGGLYAADATEGARLADLRVIGNRSSSHGGGAHVLQPYPVEVLGGFWARNEAGSGGGALSIARNVGAPDVVVDGAGFCDNLGKYGGGIAIDRVGRVDLTRSWFARNRALDPSGGGAMRSSPTTGGVFMDHVGFVGNLAPSDGAALVLDGPITVKNSFFLAHGGGRGLWGLAPASGSFSYTFFASSSLGGALVGASLSNTLSGDPGLSRYDATTPCEDLELWPAPGSALIDAGDPSSPKDADGSRADIGPFSGFDGDGDGASLSTDCDDADPGAFPGATELCDGADQDCDGAPDDGLLFQDWYRDADGDGHGGAETRRDCAAPEGFVAEGGDCDDADDAVHPGAVERCNGRDDDCQHGADGPDAADATAWYTDADGDAYGAGEGALACVAPEGTSATPGDCDDAHAEAHPGGEEVCDALDNDCDGAIDQGASDAGDWFADTDGDGFGAGAPLVACDAPDGAVADGSDCDDGDAEAFPGGTELCGGGDEDCDGATDLGASDAPSWWPDADGDGFGSGEAVLACAAPPDTAPVDGDCDDADDTVHPDAPEACDGRDEDCDGVIDDGTAGATWYADGDGDGYGAGTGVEACAAPEGFVPGDGDCDDADAGAHPGAEEVARDGVDQDCDGLDLLDGDGDGFDHGVDDCDDAHPGIHPGAPDPRNDGLDQDCDGVSEASTLGGGGCGCAGAPGGAHAGLGLLALLALRRRPTSRG